MRSSENWWPSEGETVIIGSNVISDLFNILQSKKIHLIITVFKYCLIMDETLSLLVQSVQRKNFTLVIRDQTCLAHG